MKIKKNLPAILLTLGVIVIAVLMVIFRGPKAILFYGETCPHCKIVEEYMLENGTREKMEFQELEVYNNKGNAALLNKTAKNCGFDTTGGVGVPFFYDGESCFMGDVDIISYFEKL